MRHLATALVLLLLGALPARGDMTKTVTTDAPCFIDVQWTWDPETVPDGGDHSGPGTNWEITPQVNWGSNGFSQLYVKVLHKEQLCCPEDEKANSDTVQIQTPDKNKTARKGTIVLHPAGAETHYDFYVVEFRRGLVASSNRVRVWGIHLDLSPHIFGYGMPKNNSLGCAPRIDSYGIPSATSTMPFGVTASLVLNQKSGILFYGQQAAQIPFQGGTLWVQPPLVRTPVQDSGGNPGPDDCSGAFDYEFNALIQSHADPYLVAGASVCSQYWSRDPSDPWTTSLTNGLEFTIQP